MNKDKLERYITENKEDFDLYEPDEGLWNKIQPNNQPFRKINWQRISWQAAAAVAIFILSYFFHDYTSDNTAKDQMAGETRFEEPEDQQIQMLMEAEVFYTSKINNAREAIYRLSGNDNSLMEMLNYDLEELDQVFKELKNDLKDNSDNEEVIEAMIQNYRLKLEILEEMLLQLNKSKSTDENEGYEI